MSDDRGIGYREDKTSVYRASGIGSCLTQIVAHMLEYDEAPTQFQNEVLIDAAREGNLHEDSIVDRLIEDGYRVTSTQELIEMAVIPKVIIRGHIDGLTIPPRARNTRVLEAKTMSKDRFKKWQRSGNNVLERLLTDEFVHYAWQISIYMHMYGYQAIYAVKNRDSGKLLVEQLDRPPISIETIKKKIIVAEGWRVRNELPDCMATGGEKFFCPFPYLHDTGEFGAEPDNEEDPIDDAQRALIGALAAQYHDLASQVAQMRGIDDERKSVGEKLLVALQGSEYAYAGDYKVKNVEGSRSYPSKVRIAGALGIKTEDLEDEGYWERSTYNYAKVTKVTK